MLNTKISQNKTKLWYAALIVSPLKEDENSILSGYKLLLEWKTNYLDETAGPRKRVSVMLVTVVHPGPCASGVHFSTANVRGPDGAYINVD